MKTRVAFLFVIGVAFSVAAWAQEGAQMMLIYDEAVKPDQIPQYVENSKKFFEILVEHVEDAQWNAVMTDDLHFLYAIPISSFAEVDKMYETSQAMAMSLGPEKFLKMMEESGKTVDHMDSFVVMRRDDLSYHPETMIPMAEAGVLEYSFYYLKGGTEFAAEALAKEYIAMMKKKGVEGSFTFYQLLMGQDMPAFAIIVPARSPEHLAELNAAFRSKMGAEGEALDQKSMKLIRKFDRKIGWVRPDLSSAAFRKRSD